MRVATRATHAYACESVHLSGGCFESLCQLFCNFYIGDKYIIVLQSINAVSVGGGKRDVLAIEMSEAKGYCSVRAAQARK
jgi:hypothetical protein